ncbi:uncharacterized protein LOC123425870 isoform X3 [Hordeum vulgare subsp. vulgare]|nr:uncharacterized protein LOC123425870 isoform X3 [Hordeum vulgare subsp. vulgare]
MEAEESEGYISSKGSVLFDQGGHLKPEALKQYLIAGERFYQRSSELDKEICGFETSIKRPFFHVKPLDDDQLENWNLYLDFVEKNGDFDWAVKLYERCLIPCANYSEFWIRYAEYVDAKGGREIANYALGRASSFFVKGVPSFNMYYSIFKEQIGDAPGARSLFVEGSSNFTSDFCMNINRLANMEKRMGNTKAATEIYENAIQDAMQKQNTEVLPDLYTNFAQFKYAFVDLYGGVQELRKAWARHSKLFPHNTRNPSQQYCTPDCNKRRITEFLRVAHDCSREGTITLKQSPKSETCSWLVDKEVGSQVDMDAVNSAEGQGYGEQNIVGCVDAQQEVGDTAHSQHSLDKYGIQSQMFSHASQDISHDLTVCEQIDQTTICHASVSEKAAQAESCNYDSPSNSIADPKQIDAQDKIKAIELSAVDHHPGAVCSRSEPLSGTHLLKGSPSGPTPIFSELENKQLEKIQVKLETEHDVSVSNAKPERSSDNPEATECAMEVSALSQDHIQSSQTQDLSVCAKTSSSEMAITQITTCSQFSPDNAVTAQAPLQHHMDNSQTYQSINLFLTGQNMQQMQQQGPAYAISQNIHTSPHSQVHPVAQPNQGNQQYMEMMQGYASQMWQYYQQQLYHLQTQHNQQIQSLQQQQLPTEHLQQSFTQQVQQLNQQMVLWQQQVQQQQLQQQQHAQQVQQQSDKTQGDIHSSSGDTKCEQNKHQQQESEIDHQSQKFQQQQLLYFQQQQQVYFIQQQQQMYQQQQQQQQQLMQQQQYLSQMPQQAQDVEQQQQLFQQQQQQLYDQQQKQMVVLQQQQQQFAQQQMQQYLQQQANQQVFKDQNCELSHQDARKRQLEHGQQSEASQSDGSKLRSGEQSELSYPSTPQSQCSSH